MIVDGVVSIGVRFGRTTCVASPFLATSRTCCTGTGRLGSMCACWRPFYHVTFLNYILTCENRKLAVFFGKCRAHTGENVKMAASNSVEQRRRGFFMCISLFLRIHRHRLQSLSFPAPAAVQPVNRTVDSSSNCSAYSFVNPSIGMLGGVGAGIVADICCSVCMCFCFQAQASLGSCFHI